MFSKIKTLFWYLQQPKGVTLVWMLLKRFTVYSSRENTRVESETWCKQNSSDIRLALEKMFPGIQLVMDLESTFPEEYAYAREKVKNTPYKMGGQGNTILLYNLCEYISA